MDVTVIDEKLMIDGSGESKASFELRNIIEEGRETL